MLIKNIHRLSLLTQRSFYQANFKPKRMRNLHIPLNDKKPEFTTIEKAMKIIKSGMSIYAQGTGASPMPLYHGLTKRIDDGNLKDLKLRYILCLGQLPWINPKYFDKIHMTSDFLDIMSRMAVDQGKVDYVPIILSQVPQIHSQLEEPFDVCLVGCSLPDDNGYVSLSMSIDAALSAARNSKNIIAICSSKMPYTYGDGIIHVSQLAALIHDEKYEPIKDTIVKFEKGSAEDKIGKIIADNLIDDGATIQCGIGGIPDAVCTHLDKHKNLGIHTELLSGGFTRLIKSGVVNGLKKSMHIGKHVACFAIGDQDLYDLMHKNPNIIMNCCSYTNNIEIIAKQSKMTAINSCIEIDLTGQIVADSVGKRFYSGFGGQTDFMTGAGMAYDNEGKAIMALTSRTDKGETKIVPYIKQGSGVVTTRGHVKYVVTEYGVAQLSGKSVRQRAFELINIAHPDDREMLEKEAFERLKVMPSK
uniref:Acetyl-CoA hydrolase n=1 Tax=Parastrongyloides trichosuri TaxID=131310 RepID=A0A0N4Z729_PARTI